jgi:DNA-binding NarL/FixJ family response regulator
MPTQHDAPSEPIRILVVDDSPVFLAAMTSYLRRSTVAEVIGCAGGGGEAIALAGSRSPRLVLMDFSMPGMNGIECARGMRARGFLHPIVIVTAHEGRVQAAEAAAAGVDGVVSKWRFVAGIRPWIDRAGVGARQ